MEDEPLPADYGADHLAEAVDLDRAGNILDLRRAYVLALTEIDRLRMVCNKVYTGRVWASGVGLTTNLLWSRRGADGTSLRVVPQ